jgi:hypothetical protein
MPAPPDKSSRNTITINLNIVNSYGDGSSAAVTVTGLTIAHPGLPRPPVTDRQWQTLTDWADDHLWPLTGTGRTTGSACYEVTVTASTLPWLLGHTFDWD